LKLLDSCLSGCDLLRSAAIRCFQRVSRTSTLGGTIPQPGGFNGFRLYESGVHYDLAHIDVPKRDHVRTIEGTLSLMALAASSDSKMTIANPESSFRVQYPATNPGACDTPGTTCSRRWLSAASRSLVVTVTTTACTGTSFSRWLARTPIRKLVCTGKTARAGQRGRCPARFG